MTTERDSWSKEKAVQASNGWMMLVLFILLLIGDIALFIYCAVQGSEGNQHVLLPVVCLLSRHAACAHFSHDGIIHASAESSPRAGIVREILRHRAQQRLSLGESPLFQMVPEVGVQECWQKWQSTWKQPSPGRSARGASPATRFRCVHEPSMGKSLKSTTSAATRSRSPQLSSGASRTRPRQCSTWMTTSCTSKLKASRR